MSSLSNQIKISVKGRHVFTSICPGRDKSEIAREAVAKIEIMVLNAVGSILC